MTSAAVGRISLRLSGWSYGRLRRPRRTGSGVRMMSPVRRLWQVVFERWRLPKGRRWRIGVAVVAVLAVSGGGCNGDDKDRYGKPPSDGPPTTASSGSASPSPSASLTDEQQILAQYRKFWTEALPKAFAAVPSARRSVLTSATMDPELSVLLQNMAIQDNAGERGYGSSIPLRQTVETNASVSLVRGCLDSRDAGVLSVKTGKKLTRGPAQNPVLVNLKRGSDRVWRVSFVSYPGGSKC